ncbi:MULTISPECIES: sulfur carrier protein ThiS [unclassified Fusibacter]|uniref:sulfur carrier protein ThiS n=1 Tax=unclassified Fusibacter TaxID=2624464 RepID=UPI001010C979|nr:MULTISPECIES: sulfur carrier protein ThiS [unclassified Fusibacter]MCK8059934.1 sulfur carrier protein ThiS [Fusibacter sp. A2]NPE22076.1 sulfur carrier protein ThiS [Fusibacter sp. A1]RXV60855.1 sulfur carrier protein ThiS [Fusibacter sp. A1]
MVVVNGKEMELDHKTISQMLLDLHLNPVLVVVELNKVIVEKADYDSIRLKPGDNLEVVQFVGGG